MKTLFEWLVFPFVCIIIAYCGIKFLVLEAWSEYASRNHYEEC